MDQILLASSRGKKSIPNHLCKNLSVGCSMSQVQLSWMKGSLEISIQNLWVSRSFKPSVKSKHAFEGKPKRSLRTLHVRQNSLVNNVK